MALANPVKALRPYSSLPPPLSPVSALAGGKPIHGAMCQVISVNEDTPLSPRPFGERGIIFIRNPFIKSIVVK